MRIPLCLLLLVPAIALAQAPGSFDPSFNPTDLGFKLGYGANTVVRDVVRQPDGSTIIAGSFTVYNGATARSVARITTDGLHDATFSAGTGAAGGYAQCLALQADGKVLVGGTFTLFDGQTVGRLVRLDVDGSLDGTFDIGTGFNGTVHAIAVQPDGRILVVGNFDTLNTVASGGIARLMADGSIDAGFTVATGFQPESNHRVTDVIVEPGGKIFCVGAFSTYNGVAVARMARLQADGTLDVSFTSLGINGWNTCAVRQPDGRYIVGGHFTAYGPNLVGKVVRVSATGAYDASFTTGAGFDNDVYGLALQPDGKVLVGGLFAQYNATACRRVARLQANGLDDPSFVGPGPAGAINSFSPAMHAFVVEPSGMILAAGDFLSCSGRTASMVAHLHGDGTLDTAFNPGFGVFGGPRAVVVQPDGRVLVGGQLWGYNGTVGWLLFRTLPDGALDTSFTSSISFYHWVNAVEHLRLQPDGRVLAAGNFAIGNGQIVQLARFLPNGSLDSLFMPCTGLQGNVNDLEVQADGRILVAGGFTQYNDTACERIVRLLPDGTIDTSFACTSAFDGFVTDMTVQTDGRIIAVGGFTTHSGNAAMHIARLNTDGSHDATYQTGTGPNSASAIELQSTGKAVLIGTTFFDGVLVQGGVRLGTDGARDTTFVFAPGAAGYGLGKLLIQDNDKLLISANIESMPCGVGSANIVRLLSDGDCDAGFNAGAAQYGTLPIALQADGKIIVAAGFQEWYGTGRNGLLRLHGGELITAIAPPAKPPAFVVYPDPTDGPITIDAHGATVNEVLLTDMLGRTTVIAITPTNGPLQLHLGALPDGLYLLHIRHGSGISTQRLVKQGGQRR
ncbi:MAG: T9SS type A sorting domain-containing protein [Flavobacteriales bacterium]|nr:T9SS type A sorting domain-containing protein [Flavobacteriales bacterium]